MSLVEWSPGHIIANKYTVRALIGRTAWSRSYSAITEPNREILLRAFTPDPAMESAITKRMPMLTKLEPHALSIVEVGRDPISNLDFVATSRSRHPSLASLVELCPLTLSEGVSFAESLARALDAAHAIDLFHLALNPHSVFVGPAPDCQVQLADFGMTPHPPFAFDDALWLAPEQLEGQAGSKQSDTYAAALVVFFALTGKSYWHAKDERSLREEQRRALAPVSQRALELGVTLPHEVNAIFEQALSPSISARTPNVGDFARALSKVCTRKPGAPSIVEPSDVPKVIVATSSAFQPTPIEDRPRPPTPTNDEPTVHRVARSTEPTAMLDMSPRPAKNRALVGAIAGAAGVFVLTAIVFLIVHFKKKPEDDPKPTASASTSTIATTNTAPPATTSAVTSTTTSTATSPATSTSTTSDLPPLKPTEAEIKVDCQPVQCDVVLIDAKKCSYPDATRLKPGSHGVGISAKGYWGDWKLITVGPGERTTVTFDLKVRPKWPCPKGQKCN